MLLHGSTTAIWTWPCCTALRSSAAALATACCSAYGSAEHQTNTVGGSSAPSCLLITPRHPTPRYREALSAALEARQAEVVVSVLEELAARDGLDIALGGRDAASLTPLLRFLCRHVTEPRYSKLLCSIAHRVLDLYAAVVSAYGPPQAWIARSSCTV